MNREQFFSRAVATKAVQLPDGSTVHVRKLSQREAVELGDYSTPEQGAAGTRYVVSRCTVTADGARVFTDADAELLADQDVATLNAIAKAVLEFSGVTEDPKAPLAGSAATPVDSASSESPGPSAGGTWTA